MIVAHHTTIAESTHVVDLALIVFGGSVLGALKLAIFGRRA
jgi:hypothetical protein